MREALEGSLPAEGLRARAVVESGEDIAAVILDAARRGNADVVVVGSSGMRGRKQFLLGNVANRVTHLAECTVVVVNTATGEPSVDSGPDSGPLQAARARDHPRPRPGRRAPALRLAAARRRRPRGAAAAARGVREARADLRQARPDPLDAPGPDRRGVRHRARPAAVRRPADVGGRGGRDDGARARGPVGGRLLRHRSRAARRRDDRPGPSRPDGRRPPRGGQGSAPGGGGGGRERPRAAGDDRRPRRRAPRG